MTKEEIKSKVSALKKKNADIAKMNENIAKNITTVKETLEGFFWVSKDGVKYFVRIEETWGASGFVNVLKYPHYFNYNEREMIRKETEKTVEKITRSGKFDEFMEFLLDEAIPEFIENGKSSRFRFSG